MLRIALIRHGKTHGNTLGRYIGGRTDEPLCGEGRRALGQQSYPDAEVVYISPMKRCVETAECIYPNIPQKSNALLKECDFGSFENKNYQELSDHPDYQAWIDSNGMLPFPQGESREEFIKRCTRGFAWCVQDAFQNHIEQAAMVVHGGTIMSVLSRFAQPGGEYFAWKLSNGEYYELILEEELWNREHCIRSLRKGKMNND